MSRGIALTHSWPRHLDGGSAPRPGRFNLGERPGTHCTGGWVGPQGRSGRVRKISPPNGIRSSDRPARSESLYRLSYRGLCWNFRFRTFYSKYNKNVELLLGWAYPLKFSVYKYSTVLFPSRLFYVYCEMWLLGWKRNIGLSVKHGLTGPNCICLLPTAPRFKQARWLCTRFPSFAPSCPSDEKQLIWKWACSISAVTLTGRNSNTWVGKTWPNVTFLLQHSHEFVKDWTWSFAPTGRRLNAWALYRASRGGMCQTSGECSLR